MKVVSTSLAMVAKYADAFRELVNNRIRPDDRAVPQLLHIEPREWDFLCTAMDVVGDACLAIDNFLRFGMGGPTKLQDVGEMYLRLYGLLTGVYVQQQAALELCRILDVAPFKSIKDDFDKLQIRRIRHKLAAHSVDYRGEPPGPKECYVPIRAELHEFHFSFAANRGSGDWEEVDLCHAIEEHSALMLKYLDLLMEKSPSRFYKGEESKLDLVKERLALLRAERDGAMVVELGQGKKLIITIATFAPTPSQNEDESAEETVL